MNVKVGMVDFDVGVLAVTPECSSPPVYEASELFHRTRTWGSPA